tara:strand:- start:2676 stop:2945 length:270 start_codon:yes stop_codon:yes gene_type:complete
MPKNLHTAANVFAAITISAICYSWMIENLPSAFGISPLHFLIGFGVSTFMADFRRNFSGLAEFRHIAIAGALAPFWFLVRVPALKWLRS